MFPTLFPLGLGGFELDREVKISFQKQAEYLLDLADHSFRYHKYFIFVACNILQRRQSHLHTHLSVKQKHFQDTAEKLSHFSDSLVASVAADLQNERDVREFNDEQKQVMDVLNKLNTVAAKVSGSQASKILERNAVRSYTGHFGIPQLYLTMNPDPANSPIFQVMYGDKTVDLTEQFPSLVSSGERARRLAADPVAAADFFDLSIKLFLEHLGGWDFKRGCSKKEGGLFGHIQAFYGTAEYTERGKLHGHFLVWLAGGLNPAEVHRQMAQDPEFRSRFFQFFEELIHHHLPEIEGEVDPNYEPKIERPRQDLNIAMTDTYMQEQVKKCGEALQRHQCRAVCHKYGHDQDCRFDFPHEVVESSSFEPETNSIRLRCWDSTVNYFNPVILVLGRHNHDLKCILSGKSAKAAIFYITDYITKSDINSHQSLSLLSRVIARNPLHSADIKNPIERSKILLRKWLSQFCSQQSIHAQQAVRYLRGYGDSIKSHDTIPMLSSLAVHHARVSASRSELQSNAGDADVDAEEPETEELYLNLQRNEDGTFCEASQVDDYMFRDPALSFICFYDFVRCVRKQKMKAKSGNETLPRFKLERAHPQADTHELVMFTDPADRSPFKQKVPRVIGMTVPREGSDSHALFMLTHFFPWSVSQPLCTVESMRDFLSKQTFQPTHCQIMQNWEDLYECQDERDADRIRRRQARAKKADDFTKTCFEQNGSDQIHSLDDLEELDEFATAEESRETVSLLTALDSAKWFDAVDGDSETELPDIDNPIQSNACTTVNPVWKDEIKSQELLIAQRRRGELADQVDVTVGTNVECTESGQVDHSIASSSSSMGQDLASKDAAVRLTEGSNQNSKAEQTTGLEIIEEYATKFDLNQKQHIQFKIVALQFLKTLDARKQVAANKVPQQLKPLRGLMTGPGGTGKSYVIRALQALMTKFDCAHEIRYLAPTGSAATLIGGLTIHSGLSIQIVDNKNGKSSREAGEDGERYTVSIKKKEEVHREWKNVTFLLIDEVSLLGSQLLSDLDQALRFAKECDEWFGGINVMFSGDMYQYPPVLQTPLYTPLTVGYKERPDMIKRSIGRMAWKTIDTVVEFTEQKRMSADPGYAEAVARLRKRECTLEDVNLFNSRVLKSELCPTGIDMQDELEAHSRGAVIVKTNRARVDINNRKVLGQTGGNGRHPLVISTAQHLVGKHQVDAESQKSFLKFTGVTGSSKDILPSFIPLYVGMPIIIRGRNISTDLGIANGSQATIRQIIRSLDVNGMSKVDCVIAEFAGSPVTLSGLPKGWFPLFPDTCTLPGRFTGINGNPAGQQTTRRQLPFQPGFAATGQSAQGKTLEPVFVDLALGGFHAYVAASRARSRQGLFLTRPVTLADLNKPAPSDLAFETTRLDALAHNTMVRYGFLDEAEIAVPDRETEREFVKAFKMPSIAVFDSTDSPKVTTTKKRPAHEDESPVPKAQKKARPANTSHQHSTPINPHAVPAPELQQHHPTVFGPIWDSANYSCAYDAVFMHVHASLLFDGSAWCSWFDRCNSHSHSLLRILYLPLTTDSQPRSLSLRRNAWQDYLSSVNPVPFPRRGQVFASVGNVLAQLNAGYDTNHNYSPQCTCAFGKVRCDPGAWSNNARRQGLDGSASSASLQTWLRIYQNRPSALHEDSCCYLSSHNSATFPSIAFIVNVGSFPRVLPSLTITYLGTEYHLRTIVYNSADHFAVRVLDANLTFWTHDGMAHHGSLHNPQRVTNDAMTWLTSLGSDKRAHIYIFNRTEAVEGDRVVGLGEGSGPVFSN